MPCLARWLVLLTLLSHSAAQENVGIGLDLSVGVEGVLPSLARPANASRIFHGIVFDAGSTGTRIHVYTFIQKDPELPLLEKETFQSVKPGLSAYADTPETAGETVRQLLRVAKKAVPHVEWERTPVVLRATAGLRLLPPKKAQALLDEVEVAFEESPFFVPDNSVHIMNGTDEGILAWVTVNFLTGQLQAKTKKTVGTLDLGGASTQITFLPKFKKTIESAPPDHIARFDLLSTTYELYTHSYLGNGIKAARLTALGALGAEGLERKVFESSCLSRKFREDWSFGGLTYKISGIPDGSTGFTECYKEMLKVVKGVIHQPPELQDSNTFYAFSYYFDIAVEAGLIDERRGGMVKVQDYSIRAKEVCNKLSMYLATKPFLCMDITYITCLLKDGFGFKDETILKLTQKVNNVETSWALGAIFDYFQNIKIH
ncbi:ectonucleoside triphosphate diphosphohydrolase 5 isoform X2 [Denticeps clupeoides]|uniref:ectonucleoside triphosphate diphosphohydrolase 5 isoform X2 n=1 Tax=Denticeps clupeoides TaxID=299321 RepID=UPI0010A3921B|nr:ectonucleoside triphosphate diphosphohydrolase 5-like isoform X2 [Denticeps clupeoides]